MIKFNHFKQNIQRCFSILRCMAWRSPYRYFSCSFCKSVSEAKTWNDEGNNQCESCLRLICTLCQNACDSNHVVCIDCVRTCTVCSNERMKEQNKEKKWI